jgi:TolB-like protein/Tfp pilus assembly protein PilF
MSLFSELKRRNVFRVAAAYVVTAWLVIQVVATIAPILDLPGSLQRLTLIALLIGFPIAVILAWIYELGPRGLHKDDGAPAQGFGRKIDFAIIGVLAVALVLSLVTRPSIDDHVDSSVAVIPFINMSGDPENDPFTAGIHDDLLTHLSHIRSIRTVSRTSMLQYADTTLSVPDIAAELNVATILEGGVQRSGDRIRINVQLIRADRDEHLWAKTYDRELSASNVFEIQSEIARSIADALRAALTEDDERRLAVVPTRNIDALDRYFIGRRLLEQRSRGSLEAAIQYFEQVTEIDPQFALGWSGLADAYMLMPEYSSTFDRQFAEDKARDAVGRALDIDPNIPEVKATHAWYELRFFDWDAAEAIFRDALTVSPDNVNVLHWISHVLSFQGRFDAALEYARRAVEVEPDSNMLRTNLAYILVDASQFDEALDIVRNMHAADPGYVVLRRNWFLHELRAGRPVDAVETYVGYVDAIGGDSDAAREIGDMWVAYAENGEVGQVTQALIARTQLGTEDLAQVLAAVGDGEGVIRALQAAIAEHSGSRSVFSMKVNPLYDFIRDDPRFQAMLVQVVRSSVWA